MVASVFGYTHPMLGSLKPFVPAGSDYELALAFYVALGFETEWRVAGLTKLQWGDAAFLLQDYENRELQDNLMIQVPVADLDALWQHVQASGVVEQFAVRATAPELKSWGNREVHLQDPAGVLWQFVEMPQLEYDA
jgi:uncharacterized glyoxalase superfamily protein PhnB